MNQIKTNQKKLITFIDIQRFLLILFVAYFVAVFSAQTTHAQDFALEVSPTVLKLKLDSKKETKSSITLYNPSYSVQNLTLFIKPFSAAKSLNGHVIYDSFTNATEPADIVRSLRILDNNVETKNIELKPQEKKRLDIILLPLSSPQKEYYFTIFFISDTNKGAQEIVETGSNNSYSQIQGGAGVHILASYATGTPKLVLQNFSAPLLSGNGPIPFNVTVKNNGEQYFTVRGSIEITNMFGQMVGRIDLKPVNILPNSARSFVYSESINRTQKTIVSEPRWTEKYLFGIYNARLKLSLDEKDIDLNTMIHFISFPVLLLLGLIIIIPLFLFIKNGMQTRKSKKNIQ